MKSSMTAFGSWPDAMALCAAHHPPRQRLHQSVSTSDSSNQCAAGSVLPDRRRAICTDDNGLAVFELIHRARHGDKAVLCVFDLIELDGEDLRRLPIEQRKAKLARLVRGPHPGIVLSEHYDGDGEIVFEHACKLGCEGIVSKRLGSLYRSGRSPHWLKIKNPAAPAVTREAEKDWGR
jgi:hypothetical protein